MKTSHHQFAETDALMCNLALIDSQLRSNARTLKANLTIAQSVINLVSQKSACASNAKVTYSIEYRRAVPKSLAGFFIMLEDATAGAHNVQKITLGPYRTEANATEDAALAGAMMVA